MSNYFVQIVRLAKEKELAEFKSIAMDGTKIQSSASGKKSKDSDTLSRYLKAVRKDISEYMEKCELAEEVLKEKKKVKRSDFVFNTEGDYYECPAGKKLKFERRYSRSGWKGRTYKAADCSSSSYRENCLPLHGLSNVQGEFNLMCIAHNINKMYILLAAILPLFAAHIYFKEQFVIRFKD